MLPEFEMLSGFHGIEQDEHGAFVWTHGAFCLRPLGSARFARLQLCYYGHEGTLSIRAADGRLIDQAELQHGWRTYAVQLDAAAASPLTFEISPIVSVPGESRELGMMLRSIETFDEERQFKVLTKAVRNYRLNEREYRQGVTTLKSFPPQLRVTMEVRCNLPETSQACVYCAWDFAKSVERGSPAFTYQTLEELGDFYDCATEIVDCSIGEPTMKKDFGQILERIDSDGKFISLTTNGQLLGEKRRREMLGKNLMIYVSIDSATAEGYSRYRNKRFDDIVDNLRALCREKKQHNNLPHVFTTFLVMRSNIAELPEYLDLMKDIGVDEVKLRSLNLDNIGGQDSVVNNGYQFNYFEEVLTMEELRALDPIARQLASERGVQLYNETEQFAAEATPDMQAAPSAEVCEQPVAAEPSPPLCSEPWKTMYFLRRGIMPCCYAGKPLATWEEQGDRSLGQFLGDVFNNREMQEIRSELAEGRLASYCLNTPSCPILKRMQLEGLVDTSIAASGNPTVESEPLPLVTLESLKASATQAA